MKKELKQEALKSYIPKLSSLQTFFTLMKGFVGIAMLLFPNGYHNAGWLFGTCTTLVVSGMIIFSTNLLLSVSDQVSGSFSTLGEKSMGRIGKIFCDISLGLTQTGFVCMHIVFIAQNINGIFASNFGFTVNKWLIGLACLFIYTPLCWVRRLQYFAKFHIFADISVILALVVITYFSALNFHP